MAIYRRMFVVEDVARIHRLFTECIDLAAAEDRARRQRGLPPANAVQLAKLKAAYAAYKAGLDSVAVRAAVSSGSRIREVLAATQVRADTGVSPHLRDRIVSRPLPPIAGFVTGAVGVADEAVLDRDGGFYWRAQEFGTGSAEVGSITTAATGRLLKGYFYGRGFTEPVSPDASLFRAHPIFRPGPYIAGQPYRIGVVRREIRGRHFIEKGAAAAEAQYLAGMSALERTTIAELAAIRTP